MAQTTKIEWTEATWNPWHGCRKVSAGCKNCYMFREKKQYGQDPNVVVRSKTKFYDPLKWKEPRRIFTCSWSDFFIEEADAWRDEAFAIMALTPQHTYQVLTKRPDRMMEYLRGPQTPRNIYAEVHYGDHPLLEPRSHELYERLQNWPLPNVWLGVSVEDQKTADERIPLLLQTPAALRWLSIEPLLGPIEFSNVSRRSDAVSQLGKKALTGIDWVVVGGESGPEARPTHPDWARSLRDQCTAAGVPFFFKQWGEWWPIGQMPDGWIDHQPKELKNYTVLQLDGRQEVIFPPGAMTCYKVGKKKAGRLLDGREWNEMPEVSNG